MSTGSFHDEAMSEENPDERFRVGAIWGGRYVLKRVLGRGGAGVVFAAEHLFVKRAVALKLPHVDSPNAAAGFARLRREMAVLARVRHPGVVDIIDGGDIDGIPFIAMHLLDGRTLSGLIAARGRLEPSEVVKIGVELAWTMTAVHEAGVIHRDIKPSNVLISPDATNQVRLLDFGTAKLAEHGVGHHEKLTRDGSLLGTLEYMAPEALLSSPGADQRVDIYALGVTLYECLTGTVPFEGSLGQILMRLTTEEAPSLTASCPGVPARLRETIHRSLRREASDRYETMVEFAVALAECLSDDPRTVDVLHGPRRSRAPALVLSEMPPVEVEPAPERRHERAPYIALARILTDEGTATYGRVEDISEGGVLLVASGTLAIGGSVRLRFALPLSGRVLDVTGRTCWTRTSRGVRATGCEFVDLTAAAGDEIRQYVASARRGEGSTRNRMGGASYSETQLS